jgi:hypothetical protein
LHRQGVYRFGLQVCLTTEDAEDAVQETLWAATRALTTFCGTASSIASWLVTIVRREDLHLIDRHRRAPSGLDGEKIPARVRSISSPLSNSPIALTMCSTQPARGVVVSNGSLALANPMPSAARSSSVTTMCRSDRKSRSAR